MVCAQLPGGGWVQVVSLGAADSPCSFTPRLRLTYHTQLETEGKHSLEASGAVMVLPRCRGMMRVLPTGRRLQVIWLLNSMILVGAVVLLVSQSVSQSVSK